MGFLDQIRALMDTANVDLTSTAPLPVNSGFTGVDYLPNVSPEQEARIRASIPNASGVYNLNPDQ
jgi:hypothetical protein